MDARAGGSIMYPFPVTLSMKNTRTDRNKTDVTSMTFVSFGGRKSQKERHTSPVKGTGTEEVVLRHTVSLTDGLD